jgi:hypothetical protein
VLKNNVQKSYKRDQQIKSLLNIHIDICCGHCLLYRPTNLSRTLLTLMLEAAILNNKKFVAEKQESSSQALNNFVPSSFLQ